jgi:hypothetical protein
MAMRQDGRGPESAEKGTPEAGSRIGLVFLVECFGWLAGAFSFPIGSERASKPLFGRILTTRTGIHLAGKCSSALLRGVRSLAGALAPPPWRDHRLVPVRVAGRNAGRRAGRSPHPDV